jgi:hypothetical protein
VQVTVRRKAAVPVHAAWPKLADLAALSKWAPDVASSRSDQLRLGARRVAVLKEPAYGKAELVETVTALRPQGFSYDIEGGIGPFAAITTSWDLEPRDGGCAVVVSSEIAVIGKWRFAKPLAAWGWKRQLAALAKGFAKYAES